MATLIVAAFQSGCGESDKPSHSRNATPALSDTARIDGHVQPAQQLVEKYGLPPTGGPTGREETIMGIDFIEVKPGYFRMRPDLLVDRKIYTDSALWGEIDTSFWVSRHEISEELLSLCPNIQHAWGLETRSRPALVLKEDARRYCAWLRSRGVLGCRLPTAAEWEYLCRAGTVTSDIPHTAKAATTRIYQRIEDASASVWGMFNMDAGAAEWCEDSDFPIVGSGSILGPMGNFLPSRRELLAGFRVIAFIR